MANIFSYAIQLQAQTPPPPSQDQVNSGLVYVIAAYAVIWFLIFGYLFFMHRKQASLQREVEILREEAARDHEHPTTDTYEEQPVKVGQQNQG